MNQDIDAFENNSLVNKPEPSTATKTLEEEFKQFIENRVTPIFDKGTEMSAAEEDRQLRSLLKKMEMEAGKIKRGLKLNEIVMFVEVPKHDKLESDRQAGLARARKYREEMERYDLMQALPGAHLLDQEQEPEAAEEAELLALQRQEENHQRKIQAMKEEIGRKKRGDS